MLFFFSLSSSPSTSSSSSCVLLQLTQFFCVLFERLSSSPLRLLFPSRPDDDECQNVSDICGERAECSNTDGSYDCTCVAGYTSTGPPRFQTNDGTACTGKRPSHRTTATRRPPHPASCPGTRVSFSCRVHRRTPGGQYARPDWLEVTMDCLTAQCSLSCVESEVSYRIKTMQYNAMEWNATHYNMADVQYNMQTMS